MMIGIDLGTTNSCVAWYDGNKTEMIEVPGGGFILPSVVSYADDGTPTVGRAALRKVSQTFNPRYVFSNVKREIGRPYVDGQDYGSQIVEGHEGKVAFKAPHRDLLPEEVSAEILKALKAAAERRIGKKVTGVVLTHPAYFDNHQIKATREAATLAGFRKVVMFSEPEAAALAFGIQKETYSRVIVFDLGGGTFDVVLMEAGKNGIEISNKDGWDRLGGLNFDAKIQDMVLENYQKEHGADLSDRQIAMMKLARAAEDAKLQLTDETSANVLVHAVSFDDQQKMMADINQEVTREAFEARCQMLVSEALAITKRVMDKTEWDVRQVSEVLLVGGMTRVPMVRQALADMFGEKKLRDRVSPDLAVAEGAAIKAAMEDGRYVGPVSINDIVGRPFGIEIEGGVLTVVVPRGAPRGEVVGVEVTTAQDNQNVIPIAVLEGEAGDVGGSTVLARYDHRVSPAPAGSQTVALEFMVDENGLLMVAGKDTDTGEAFNILGAD